jgi:hypothetical protein
MSAISLSRFSTVPAGESSTMVATGQELLDLIARIDKIFWETKAAAWVRTPRTAPT